MKQPAVYVLGMLLLAALPALAGPPVKTGNQAPEISAKMWLNLPKGMEKFSPEDLKGKVLYVDFWATW